MKHILAVREAREAGVIDIEKLAKDEGLTVEALRPAWAYCLRREAECRLQEVYTYSGMKAADICQQNGPEDVRWLSQYWDDLHEDVTEMSTVEGEYSVLQVAKEFYRHWGTQTMQFTDFSTGAMKHLGELINLISPYATEPFSKVLLAARVGAERMKLASKLDGDESSYTVKIEDTDLVVFTYHYDCGSASAGVNVLESLKLLKEGKDFREEILKIVQGVREAAKAASPG